MASPLHPFAGGEGQGEGGDSRIGRFFQEAGVRLRTPLPGTPSDETIRHLLEISARYGYWNASPEENARIGISLPWG